MAISSSCSEHMWYDYPIHIGNIRILCNPFAVPPTQTLPSNHRICPAESPVVYADENLLHAFICFLFVDGRGNTKWGQYVSLMQQHCFTAFSQSMESLRI